MIFRFLLTIVLVVLAFVLGVFVQHNFRAVEQVQQKYFKVGKPAQMPTDICPCTECNKTCCPGCPGIGGSGGKCTCPKGQCTCCIACEGRFK